jgi:predicted CoA-substrate-specific enzyme activase
MDYYVGIDIGSTAIKIAIIDENGDIKASSISPTGSSFYNNTKEALSALLMRNNINADDIKYSLSTGYGRKLYKDSDGICNEITANAVGVKYINKKNIIRTIINIGGQDSKVILLDEVGDVKNFVMNDKCAAGTGRFLEMAARTLEVDISELSDLHDKLEGPPMQISSTCAVFAESEIISLLAIGTLKEQIVAGIHYSIARRIARLADRMRLEETIIFDGGTALNKGVLVALKDELMQDVIVSEYCQITTAIGAALIAKKSYCNI